MNKKYYQLMVVIGTVLWIAETALFGWNTAAQSNAERVLDTLSAGLILWGVAGDIASGLVINKVTKIKHVEHFTINNVEEFRPIKGGEQDG